MTTSKNCLCPKVDEYEKLDKNNDDTGSILRRSESV